MLNQASSLLHQTSFMPDQATFGVADVLPAVPAAPLVAPTYFATAANPVDGGALSAVAQVAITPPASMAVGDLVVAVPICRSLSLTWSVNTTGGQTWNTSTTGLAGQAGKTMGVFWCRFNGTWAANPVFEALTNVGAISGIMHVFRPDVSTRVWAVDVAIAQVSSSVPTGPPYIVTRTGLTTAHSRTVTLAGWFPAAGNTWSNLSGAGWAVTGGAQYRNGSASITFAHALNANSAIVVPDVSKEESAATAALTFVASWYAA